MTTTATAGAGPVLRLHGYWRSSSTWRVRIGLGLKGLTYGRRVVNLLAGEQWAPEHRARSPLAQIPVLEVVEGGRTTALVQSMAILEWLDERFPDPPLLPADLAGRARVRALAEHVNSGIQPLQNALVLRMLKEKLPGYEREWARLHIANGLAALEQALGDGGAGRFCHGDAPGLADCYLVPQLGNARRFGVDLAPYPTLRRIDEAASALAPFRAAHPDAQPDAPPESGGDRTPRAPRQRSGAASRVPALPSPRAAGLERGPGCASARTSGTSLPSLGIRRVEALHAYVHDLARSRRLLVDGLDFAEVAQSGPELTRAGRQRSAVFEAGGVRIVCSEPDGEGGRAFRWLRKHPEGIGAVVLEVEDAERCFRLLEERGGTPLDDVREHRDDGGTLRTFSITAPLGDSTLRFVERRGARALYPGLVPLDAPRGGRNALGFREIDHLTANFQTMKPALLWMEHVLGFEPFWDVQFRGHGSGLRSVVMRDPASGMKVACNEPWRPAFRASQINVFNEDHRGDGIQHAALAVQDILSTVRELRRRGVGLMPTPASYYDALPERLRQRGVGRIDEDVAELRDLGILVDGAAPGAYLLQIFLQDAAGFTGDREAGPFFFEIIQRKGDPGFGEGNFRALFESIERTQRQGGGRS